MRSVLVLVLLAVCPLSAADLKIPPEVQAIPGLASGAPPEFDADALLRMLETRKIADRETIVTLAQQAFDLASHAHFRVAMRWVGTKNADTREGSLANAYGLNLDALSLQARAVRAVLPIDRGQARQMFQSMVLPDLPPLKCSDALVYDPSAYYSALGQVASMGFTAKERAKEDHVAFVLQYVSHVTSPSQIAPAMEAIKAAGLTPDQLGAVSVRLAGQMEAIFGDNRSFTAAIGAVTSTLPPEMSASLRKYADKNLTGMQCGTTADTSVKPEGYWQSDEAKRLLVAGQKLRSTDSGRATPEWRQQLTDFEKELNVWTAASEKSETDYYNQKCIVYEALVELIPRGPDRDAALQAFVEFMGGSNLQTTSPVEWFAPAAAMLTRVRNSNDGEPGKVLAAFEASGNPVLVLDAALEALVQRPSPWFVPTP